MKKRFTLITAAMMLLAFLAIPFGIWGQVREDIVYKQTIFNSTNNSASVGSYSSSWSNTTDGFTVNITNASNNNNGWNYIKIGHKSTAYTGTLITAAKIDKAVTKVVMNISAIDQYVNSMTLYTSSDGSTWSSAGTFAKSTGDKEVSIASPTANLYYKIEVVCTTGGSNGHVTITTIKYYKENEATVATPTFSPVGGNYTVAQNVEINCSTPNSHIYYTTDGTTPTDASTQYNSAIEVSTTTTIKAIAYVGEQVSVVASATYNILTPLTTMDAIFTAATAAASTPTLVAITYDNWVVSGVNGSNAYVTDGTKGFIVYQSGHGFSVGNILSGTAFCNIQLYNGSAELTGLTASTPGLTVNTGGVITPQTAGIATLGGVNTGAVYAFSGLTCSKTDASTVTLSDGESNELKVLKSLYSSAYGDFSDGLVYNVTGVYLQYNTTKEILPRAAADIEVVTIPSITASNVNLAYNATSGEIPYIINYPKEGGVLTAAKDASDWISNVVVDGANNKVTFDVTQNMTNAPRNGVITLTYTYTAKVEVTKDVTITQGVRDYAELPVVFDGGKNNLPIGFTYTGLGSDYSSSPKLRFDTEGDNLILKINEAATQLHFDIKSNSANGTFKVQTSTDGTSYSDLDSYAYDGNNVATTTKSYYSLTPSVRFIKWIYSERTGGNVALGNIRVSANANDYFVDTELDNLSGVTTVYSPATLTFTGTNANPANLIIENGGQLYTESAGVKATVKKDITGYGNDVSVKHGWNLIALPVTEEYTPAAPMTSNEYDLYYLDNTIWRNYKNNTFNLVNGKGYLYANSDNVTLTFAGTVKPYTGSNTVDLTDGWNLVGNPYTFNVYSNKSFYKITTDGEGNNVITVSIASDAITPCRGIVVRSDGASTLAFNKTAGEWSKGNINLALSQQVVTRDGSREAVIDNAIVSFNEGSELEKFYFGESNANVYIPQGNNEYAIVTSDGKNGIPVNFKAAENGTYTLSFEVENTEMNYLHLIDKLTGNDIDLLATPEYTFSAKRGDGENRFRLVFEANGNALVTSNEPFAYFNGSEWVIENDGNATLQVIDVMGRMLRSENVSGNATTSLPNLSAGVYVLRLVNSESIRTQKVVIE